MGEFGFSGWGKGGGELNEGGCGVWFYKYCCHPIGRSVIDLYKYIKNLSRYCRIANI